MFLRFDHLLVDIYLILLIIIIFGGVDVYLIMLLHIFKLVIALTLFFTEWPSDPGISRSASLSCCNFEGIVIIFSKFFESNSSPYSSSTSWNSGSRATRISFLLSFLNIFSQMGSNKCWFLTWTESLLCTKNRSPRFIPHKGKWNFVRAGSATRMN